jgi:hypothetical protein
MATLDEINRQSQNRIDIIILFVRICCLLPAFALYFYCTYYLVIVTADHHKKLYFLFIPTSLGAIYAIWRFTRTMNYWRILGKILLVITSFLLVFVAFDFFEDAYYKPGLPEYYIATFIATGVVFRLIVRPDRSSTLVPNGLFLFAVLSFAIPLALAYHFFFMRSLMIYPKAKLSTNHTFVTQDDIYKLIQEFDSKPGTERLSLTIDPYIQTLKNLQILEMKYDPLDSLLEDSVFNKKHMDAFVRLREGNHIKEYFFPSGFYKFQSSNMIRGYYLRSIHVTFDQEFGYDFALRLVFQKDKGLGYLQYTTTDTDTVDSTFTANVNSSLIGQFTVHGRYHFKKSPEEVPEDSTAISIYYSNQPWSSKSVFKYFRPQRFQSK